MKRNFPGRLQRRSIAVALALVLTGCAPKGPPPIERGNAILHEDVVALLDQLVQAVRDHSTDATARGELAMAYDANGLKDEALQTYEQAVELDRDSARWHYHYAIVLAETGDYPRAVVQLDSTIALDREYSPSYWRRGQFQFAQGEFDAAEASFREARRLRPQHPAGAVGLARVHLQRKEGDAAVRVLEDTLANLSRAQFLPYLHYLLGTAYRQTGRIDDARRELALGRRGGPLWRDPWRRELEQYQVSLRGRLGATRIQLEMGRSADVLPILEQMRSEAPNDRGLLDQLSRAYFNLGRVAEAQAVLEHCVNVHPDDERSFRNLSRVHQARGAIPDAVRTAAHAVELNPNIAAAHGNYASILASAGRREEAMEAYRAALGCDPSHLDSLLKGGSLAAVLGYWEEAHACFDRALLDHPSLADALIGRGKAAGAMGRLRDGIRDLEAAQALQPNNAAIRAELRRMQDLLDSQSK